MKHKANVCRFVKDKTFLLDMTFQFKIYFKIYMFSKDQDLMLATVVISV